jgi:phytoene dehydrogenase-like protein
MVDAVVIGAGVNGLVAANMLADAGWSVAVVDAADEPGGACRSGEYAHPGFTSDLASSFYPVGMASPVLAALKLEQHGLVWTHSPAVLAHPVRDAPAAVLHRDLDLTAAGLDADAPGDGAAWRGLAHQWDRLRDPVLGSLFSSFPPVRSGLLLARRTGVADLLRLARFATLPARKFVEEEFSGTAAGLLFAGNAMHTDVGPDVAGSAIFGWMLTMLGQDVGYPVAKGGAGQLSGALVSRAHARGAVITTGAKVQRIIVRNGRAVGVVLEDRTEIPADQAVVADVDAPQLYGELIPRSDLPARLLDDLRRFEWDSSTVKVDWALSGPIPWTDPSCAPAGTVHLGGDMDEIRRTAAELQRGVVPADPFVLVGQMTTSDPSRSPAGTEAAWGYLHVPQKPRGDAGATTPADAVTGRWDAAEVDRMVERMEARLESFAPGFRDRIVGRFVQSPLGLQDGNMSLHRGALNGGTAALHQQLVFRPIPGLGRAETPVRGLFLASMAAHPGGGVHGGPGATAARAALKASGLLGPIRTAGWQALLRAIYGS